MKPTAYATNHYVVTRNLRSQSEYQIKRSSALLENWCGKTNTPADLFKLTELGLSRFIKSLELLYSPVSVKKIRGDILCLANAAADADLRPVLRQRRVRRPVC